MTTLIIRDLSHTDTLDHHALASVRGGIGMSYPALMGQFPTSFQDFSFKASQLLGQSQNTENNNGNNVAWASGITSTVTPTQNGSNNITFG